MEYLILFILVFTMTKKGLLDSSFNFFELEQQFSRRLLINMLSLNTSIVSVTVYYSIKYTLTNF